MLFNRTVKSTFVLPRRPSLITTWASARVRSCCCSLKLTPLCPRTYRFVDRSTACPHFPAALFRRPRGGSAAIEYRRARTLRTASLFLGTHHRLTKQSVFGTHASPRLAASAGERCRWARAASVRLRALRHQAHVRRRLPGQSVEPHRQRRVCLPQPVLERLVARRVGRVRVRDTGDELRELRLVLSDELLLLGIGLLR